MSEINRNETLHTRYSIFIYEKMKRLTEFNDIFRLVGSIEEIDLEPISKIHSFDEFLLREKLGIKYKLKNKSLIFENSIDDKNLNKLENMLSTYLNTHKNLRVLSLFCDYIFKYTNKKVVKLTNKEMDELANQAREEYEKELAKYMCSVHVWGDTTSCGGDITNAKMQCKCGRFICLNCENEKWYKEASCAFCKSNLAEQFQNIEIEKIAQKALTMEQLTEEENDKLYDYLKPNIRRNNMDNYKLTSIEQFKPKEVTIVIDKEELKKQWINLTIAEIKKVDLMTPPTHEIWKRIEDCHIKELRRKDNIKLLIDQLNVNEEKAITLLNDNNWDIVNAIMNYEIDENLSDIQIAEIKPQQTMIKPQQTITKSIDNTSHDCIDITDQKMKGYDRTFTRGINGNNTIEKSFNPVYIINTSSIKNEADEAIKNRIEIIPFKSKYEDESVD